MGRPALAIGTYVKIATTKKSSGFVAKARIRDLDGVVRPIEAWGTSISAAEHTLRERIGCGTSRFSLTVRSASVCFVGIAGEEKTVSAGLDVGVLFSVSSTEAWTIGLEGC
jgi:hypothetical protein